jgi:hypothetical protein
MSLIARFIAQHKAFEQAYVPTAIGARCHPSSTTTFSMRS